MSGHQISLFAHEGNTSEKVAISTASAESKAITQGVAVVTPDINCFFRQGANPIALSTGVDQLLLANNTYRIASIKPNNKLAFITASGSGSVYITPGE